MLTHLLPSHFVCDYCLMSNTFYSYRVPTHAHIYTRTHLKPFIIQFFWFNIWKDQRSKMTTRHMDKCNPNCLFGLERIHAKDLQVKDLDNAQMTFSENVLVGLGIYYKNNKKKALGRFLSFSKNYKRFRRHRFLPEWFWFVLIISRCTFICSLFYDVA